MVRQWQELDYHGRYSHSYMDALPDFVKLAEAYGHVGMKIEKPGDVEGAARGHPLKDRTVFLDVRTDPTENVWPMVRAARASRRCCWAPRNCDAETPARAIADRARARSRRDAPNPGRSFLSSLRRGQGRRLPPSD